MRPIVRPFGAIRGKRSNLVLYLPRKYLVCVRVDYIWNHSFPYSTCRPQQQSRGCWGQGCGCRRVRARLSSWVLEALFWFSVLQQGHLLDGILLDLFHVLLHPHRPRPAESRTGPPPTAQQRGRRQLLYCTTITTHTVKYLIFMISSSLSY